MGNCYVRPCTGSPHVVGGAMFVSRCSQRRPFKWSAALAASATFPVTLGVVGNKLVDTSNNRPLKLVGVSLCDAAIHDQTQLRTLIFNGDLALNCLRIPCTPAWVTIAGSWTNYINTYVKPAVDLCVSNGWIAILDNHLVEDANTTQANTRTTDFINNIGNAFKTYTNIIYEIFNEPIAPNGNLAAWQTFKTTLTTWIDALRVIDPDAPIIVGSGRYSKETRFAAQDPIARDNLLYTYHYYPTNVAAGAAEALSDAQDTVAIAITETGFDPDDPGDTLHYGTASGFGANLSALLDECPYAIVIFWSADILCTPTLYENVGGTYQPKDSADPDEFYPYAKARSIAEIGTAGNLKYAD